MRKWQQLKPKTWRQDLLKPVQYTDNEEGKKPLLLQVRNLIIEIELQKSPEILDLFVKKSSYFPFVYFWLHTFQELLSLMVFQGLEPYISTRKPCSNVLSSTSKNSN